MQAFDHYARRLAQQLSIKKYRHSVAVAETAVSLGAVHGIHKGLAYLAGLLHDYARELPLATLIDLMEMIGMPDDPVTQASPELWHGPVGAYLVEKELGLKEPQLLQAIAIHTLGAPGMSDLDKVVFLADLIEPERVFPGVDIIKERSFLNLDEGMLVAYDQSFSYLIANKFLVHPAMIESRNQLLLAMKKKGS